MDHAPITLEHAAVRRALDHIDAVQTMRALFVELGEGQAVQPPQTVTEFPQGGDFITYLGALGKAGVFGAKLSPYLPQENGALITAWTVLMSMQSGTPLAMLDAGALTTERTAATTALAVDHLAATGRAFTLAIIGTGAIAQAHLRYVAPLRDWNSIRVYSPSLAANTDLQNTWHALDPRVQSAPDAAKTVDNADVVMLCTSSGTPVIDTTLLKLGCLVTSISTNVAQAHEVDPAFLPLADVYCDYRQTTPSSAGEMVIAQRDHGWSPSDICGDLADLAVGRCAKPSGQRPVFFRSIGLGLEDIAIAHAIYQQARP
ncbi:ornithine cyclodeaminase family protein [Cognatishimia sp.]|uniref:ornithine cyclodeaminase family protein n=1 Tax=Cognatishimia sp. TaxID=2211648 RepID=UPI0035123CE0